jgi:hypothetical protein
MLRLAPHHDRGGLVAFLRSLLARPDSCRR